MKVDLRSFAEGMLNTGIGLMAGKLAGQQHLQQQQEQEFNRNLNLAALAGNQQEQQNRLLTSQFPNMTPESVGQALTDISAQPSPYANILGTPYAQAHPEVGRILGGGRQPQAPAGAPGGMFGAVTGQRIPAPAATAAAPTTGAAPAGGGTTFTAGGRKYALKGLSKEQIAQRVAQVKTTRDLLRNQVAAITDPTVRAHAGGILADLDAADVTTKEGYDAAGQALQRADQAGYTSLGAQNAATAQQTQQKMAYDAAAKNLQGASPTSAMGHIDQMFELEKAGAKAGSLNIVGRQLAPFGKQIEEMRKLRDGGDIAGATKIAAAIQDQLKRGVEPGKEGEAFAKLGTNMARVPASQLLNPAFRRKMFNDVGLGKMTIGPDGKPLPDDQIPMFGGAAMEAQLDKNLREMGTEGFKKGSKESQTPLIQRTLGLAKALNVPLTLPAQFISEMTDYQQQMLWQGQSRINISGDLRDVAQAHLKLSQDQFAYRKKTDAAKAKEAKFTPVQRETLAAARKGLGTAQEAFRTGVQGLVVLPGEMDESNPKTQDEQKYVDLLNGMRQAEDHLRQTEQGLGITPAPKTYGQGTSFTPPPVPPKMERKTILGVPYGEPVPVEGQQQQPGAVQAAPAAATTTSRQDLNASTRGQRAAKEAVRTKTPPVPQPTLDFIKSKSGSGWLPWVGTLSPVNQEKAWAAYWYNQFSQAGKKTNGSSGTSAKR